MSGIKIYEGDLKTDNTNKFLLDKHILIDNTEYTKIAYVTKVVEGKTEMGDKFFRFYLKDCNSTTVVGRLFNPAKGLTTEYLNNMKNKIVKISFIANEYMDDMNLNISEIELVPSPTEMGLKTELFIGVVDDLDDLVDRVVLAITSTTRTNVYSRAIQHNNLISKCRYGTIEGVAQGKLGSPIYLMNKVCDLINVLASDSEQAKDLCIQYVLAETVLTIQDMQENKFELGSNKIKVLKKISSILDVVSKAIGVSELTTSFERSANHIAECLMGVSEPQTLGSVIVKNARDLAVQVCETESGLAGLSKGSLKQIGGIKFYVV